MSKFVLFGLSFFSVILLYLVVFHTLAYAATDTCTWTGAVSGDTSDSANWTGCDNGNIPESGDTLIFPDTAITKTVIYNTPVELDTIRVSGNSYTFQLGTFNPRASNFDFYGASTSFQSGVDLEWTSTYATEPTMNVEAQTDLRNIIFQNLAATYRMEINQDLNILGGLYGSAYEVIKSGSGTLTINGYGDLYIDNYYFKNLDGKVVCKNSDCFGDGGNAISFEGGANHGVFEFEGNLTIDYFVELNFNNIPQQDDVFVVLKNATNMSFNGDWYLDDLGLGLGTNAVINLNNAIVNMNNNIYIDDAESSLSFMGQSGYNFIRFSNDISGLDGSSFILGGNVNVEFFNDKTFDGDFILFDNVFLLVSHANGLGSTLGDTYLYDNSSIELRSESSGGGGRGGGIPEIAENFYLASSGNGSGEVIKISSNLLTTGNFEFTEDATISFGRPEFYLGPINLPRNVAASGNLTFKGESSYIICGTQCNFDVAGDIILNLPLEFQDDGFIKANRIMVSENQYIDFYGTGSGEGNVSDSTEIILSDNSGIYFAGLNETIRGIYGSGTFEFDSFDILRLSNPNGTFSGILDYDGTIEILSGQWRLLNALIDSVVSINNIGGTLIFDSNFLGAVSLGSGAKLLGTGSINVVIAGTGSTVNPGSSPGCINITNFTMTAGSVFEVEIDGDTPCTLYDRLNAQSVDLGNATLDIVLGYTPNIGDEFLIIDSDTLIGEFDGLPDNALISVDNVVFRINYDYLNGDVILEVFDVEVVTSGGGETEGSSGPVSSPELGGTGQRVYWKSALTIISFSLTILLLVTLLKLKIDN
ncbi:MAG: hypothetical protein KatS3mg086_124 [Candidatus Dojkabacteria bacterium]|nr:MAG: hypothetical protein KatS3mg086_124 [Candidatus Dojkabacteria bacterium]